MPEPDVPPPVIPATPDEPPMVAVKIVRSLTQGLTLEIDATRFHAYLDALGVSKGPISYNDLPPQDYSGALNRYEVKVQPQALCFTKHVATYRLADHYSGGLTFDQLVQLAQSVKDAAKKVIDHYRPIEISVKLVEKK